MVVEEARKAGPVLVIDAGNALFRAPGMTDDANKARAKFIIDTMGKLGTQAMAVGVRDLDLGVAWLKASAAAAKVQLLSANLVGKDGKPLFPASTTLTVGGVKVGLIGASPPTELDAAAGAKGGPAAPAVIAEAKKLRPKVDVVLVLAALPYGDALQLSNEAKDAVDLVFISHDARGAGSAQRAEGNYIVPTGERGRQVGRLELDLSGKGPFVDLEQSNRESEMAKNLGNQLVELKKRMDSATDPKLKADLKVTIEGFEKSKADHEKLAIAPGKGGRTLKLDWINLGPERPDDPALRAEVEKIEPPGSPQH
jgi:2',3'-cyclic-nucleotide 2'-phosphodiesterase (5'-nucleotidase family)